MSGRPLRAPRATAAVHTRTLRPLAMLAACLIHAATAHAGASAIAPDGPRPSGTELVLYYANETHPDVLSSANYQVLLQALDGIDSPELEGLADRLRADTVRFPEEVQRQIEAIRDSAAAHGFTALVFSNALARRHAYLVFDGGDTRIENGSFGQPATPHAIYDYAPLSRKQGLQAALQLAAHAVGNLDRQVVLITNSHGNRGCAIMPRVFADFTGQAQDDLVLRLRSVASGASPLEEPQDPVAGISKLEYWQILGQSAFASRLGLVLREGCGSGVSTLREAATIPGSVDWIATSGDAGMAYGELDYAQLFAALPAHRRLSDELAVRIRAQGLEVLSPPAVWLALAKESWRMIPRWVWFVPLGVWIGWYARRSWRDGRRPGTPC